MKSTDKPGPALSARLEQVLAQWQQWRCTPPLPGAPHVQRTLPGGLSNYSFLVTAAQRCFVVRLDGVSPRQHGLSRQAEFRTLQAAAAAGLAPTPCYFNPELGALVCQYLPADTEQAVSPAELAVLCRRIHQLPRRHHRLDLQARLHRYRTQITREGKPLPAQALEAEVTRLLRSCEAVPPVLCHNDLLPANLLHSAGQLYALDWEYCAMGNPWFDLAAAGDGQNFTAGEFELFLSAYMGRAPTTGDWRQLDCHRLCCHYLALLWHLLQAGTAEAGNIIAQRQPALEALLTEGGDP